MGRIVRRESASWLFRFGLLTAISWLQGLCARLVNRLRNCDQIGGTPDGSKIVVVHGYRLVQL